MKSSYRILKLKSGEQLITSIKGQDGRKLVLFRPMIFKSTLITDPVGRQREITVLRNWLAHTDQIETEIPRDFIATFLVPDGEVVQLYDLEKEKEDTQPIPKEIIDKTKVNKQKSFLDFLQHMKNNMEVREDLENMLDDMEDLDEDFEIEDEDEDGDTMQENPKEQFQNLITMTMFFPPEVLLTLIDAGLLDAEDFKGLINGLNNYTGDDNIRKSNEDFGNHWTDWSPDLSDYVKNKKDKDKDKE